MIVCACIYAVRDNHMQRRTQSCRPSSRTRCSWSTSTWRQCCEIIGDSLHLCCEVPSTCPSCGCSTSHDLSWLQVEGWVVHVRVFFDCGRLWVYEVIEPTADHPRYSAWQYIPMDSHLHMTCDKVLRIPRRLNMLTDPAIE